MLIFFIFVFFGCNKFVAPWRKFPVWGLFFRRVTRRHRILQRDDASRFGRVVFGEKGKKVKKRPKLLTGKRHETLEQ